MHHQRRVQPVELPGVQHGDLAATALLGGCADDVHGDRPRGVGGAHHQRRPDRGRRDQVVPACVPEPGQGVVLGDERDVQRPVTRAGVEGGVQPRGLSVDVEPVLGQQRGQHPVGAELLPRRFRIGMQPGADTAHQVPVTGQVLGGDGFRGHRAP